MDVQSISTGLFLLPFAAIICALLACWIPYNGHRRDKTLLLIPALPIVLALAFEVIDLFAALSLVIFVGVGYAHKVAIHRWLKLGVGTLLFLLCIAFSMHAIPGFNNPVLFERGDFRQYANFDKAFVAYVLLAFVCHLQATHWKALLQKAALPAVLTISSTLLVGLLLGLITPRFSFATYTLVYMGCNLFFTCFAEESFFRGMVQRPLKIKTNSKLSIIITGLFFGLLHFGGGWLYVIAASVAGLGYAWTYDRTERLEAAILVHWLLNITTFTFFQLNLN